MKKRHTAALPFMAWLCLTLAACHKDNKAPVLTVPLGDTIVNGTLKVGLSINGPQSNFNTTKQYELIFSEPAGKVLLDTVMQPGTQLHTTLSTNATLIDLTNVYYDTVGAKYHVVTYKGVNPSGWLNNLNRTYIAPQINDFDTAQGYMYYTNVPNSNNFMFSQNYISENGGSDTIDQSNHTVALSYIQTPGNYAYALFPVAGLYNFHLPKWISDTVDCTTLDPAVTLNFPPSPNYVFYMSQLYGYLDTTNVNKSLWLYNYFVNPLWTLPDLEYPPALIQKYALQTIWTSANQETVNTYTYSGTVPSSFVLPDPNAYSIGANQVSNFSVSFTGPKPTYYYTSWQNAAIIWTLYASPDSASLQPLNLLTAQKSKLLQGQSLSSLALKGFQYENVQGYGYAGFLGLTCDTALLATTRVVSSTIYAKTF